LTSITIPSSVNSIGMRVFEHSWQLTSVYLNPTEPPQLGSDSFLSNNLTQKIKVPAASLTKYQNAAGWSVYKDRIVAQ